MYAVLSTKVKTDCGQAIVRKYEITFDAKIVYEELTEHHLRSNKGVLMHPPFIRILPLQN
jgi:hypothetical protein